MLALLALLAAGLISPAGVQASSTWQEAAYGKAADSLQEGTGLAVAPGLMLLARGLYRYATAEEGSALPWHADPRFLAALAILLALFLLKDFIPAEPLQKLLAALEEGSMYVSWGRWRTPPPSRGLPGCSRPPQRRRRAS
jgi:hypothetical protein